MIWYGFMPLSIGQHLEPGDFWHKPLVNYETGYPSPVKHEWMQFTESRSWKPVTA
jgi:hypothetical protein